MPRSILIHILRKTAFHWSRCFASRAEAACFHPIAYMLFEFWPPEAAFDHLMRTLRLNPAWPVKGSPWCIPRTKDFKLSGTTILSNDRGLVLLRTTIPSTMANRDLMSLLSGERNLAIMSTNTGSWPLCCCAAKSFCDHASLSSVPKKEVLLLGLLLVARGSCMISRLDSISLAALVLLVLKGMLF